MNTRLGENSSLTQIEIEIIVDKAVRQTFITLGADLTDNKSLLSLQKDFAYMRNQRVGGEKLADRVRAAGVAAVVGGALYAFWMGVKMAFTMKGLQ